MHGADAARPVFPENFEDFQFSGGRCRQVVHEPVSITEELKLKSLGIRRRASARVKSSRKNSKPEIRNPKQTQNSKAQRTYGAFGLNCKFLSNFGFRISQFAGALLLRALMAFGKFFHGGCLILGLDGPWPESADSGDRVIGAHAVRNEMAS